MSAPYKLLILLCFSSIALSAQEEKQGRSWPIQLHGGIGVTTTHYHSITGGQRFMPYSYGLNGSLRMNVGDFTVPISLYFSQVGVNTVSNFNRIGFSPSYKNLKLHLGHRSMSFSPYVLNGNNFLGVGFEYSIGKLRLAGMKGKLQNLDVFDTQQPILGLEFLRGYNRDVLAGKVGLGSESNYFDLVFFKGNDKISPEFLDDNPSNFDLALLPKSNVALGFNTAFNFKNRLFISASGMGSLYNDNATAESLNEEDLNFLNSVFEPTITGQAGFAGQMDISYRINRTRIGVNVEKVSPQFETLGRHYQLNDTERLRTTFTSSFKKFRVNGSFGIQRNELSDINLNSTVRTIVSLNMRYKVIKGLSIRGKLSNFNTDNTPELIEDNDTLKAVRVLTSASLTPQYRWGKNRKHSLLLTTGFRKVDNKLAFSIESRETSTIRSRLNYNLSIKALKLKVGGHIQYQRFDLSAILRENLGSGIMVSKSLLNDKVRASFRFNIIANNVNGKSNGMTLNNILSVNYSPFKGHTLSLRSSYFSRSRNVGNDLSDIRSNLSYNYSF